MECDKIKQLLSLYLDNELLDDEKEVVEEHLKICKKCNSEYNELRMISSLIKSIEQTPSSSFNISLHNKLLRQKTHQLFIKRLTQAVAFCIVIIIAMSALYFYNTQEITKPPLQIVKKEKKIIKPLKVEVAQKEEAKEKIIEEQKIVKIENLPTLPPPPKSITKPDKEQKIVKPKVTTDYKEAVVKVNILSNEDKTVEVKIGLPEQTNTKFVDTDNKLLIYSNINLKKDIPTTFLIPILIKDNTRLTTTLKQDTKETEFEFFLVYPKEDVEELPSADEGEETTLGHYLVFLPFKNVKGETIKKDEIIVDIAYGKLTFAEITFKRTFYIPNLKGETYLTFANGLTDITNFQVFTY